MDTRELFNKIFDESKDIVCDESVFITRTDMTLSDINLSTIATKLIQAAGRWCEYYASDFLYTWNAVKDSIFNHLAHPDDCEADVIVFGFRKNGVDHDTYIQNHIENVCSITNYYSKVYAVQVMNYKDGEYDTRLIVTLKDVLSEVETANYHYRNNLSQRTEKQ